MGSVRWRKLANDIATEKGRALAMVVALAVSLFGVGSVLGAYSILGREMAGNYLGTNPASAAIDLDRPIDATLLEEARHLPGIADAQAGEIVAARVKVGPDWRPLLLFVVDDFQSMRINTFRRQSGAWPPPTGTMLIERTAASVLRASEEDAVSVKTPNGEARQISISGVVHDPGLAPAWQEEEGYGYITPATLGLLGERPVLEELRIVTSAHRFDARAIEAKSIEVTAWLKQKGFSARQVRIPPPGRHPHQTQMFGVIFLLLAFSAMALVLSAALVATSLAAMLARQIREIGVMKTLGARWQQIAVLYAVFVSCLGALALVLALPLGQLGARALAGMSARMLNLSLESRTIPGWVLGVQALSGLLVPLLVAAYPIAKASRMSVRDAIDQHGVATPARRAAPEPKPSWWTRIRFATRTSRTLLLVLRNVFRRRTRLALTLGLLAAGGAMFMTARNLTGSWGHIVDRVYENRSYDVEIRLEAPAGVVERLSAVPGVKAAEAWGYVPSAISTPNQIDIVRTYPDGSHGSLVIMGPPANTRLVRFPLLSGRWLEPEDTNAVVLNHMVLAQAPGAKVGDNIDLSFGGNPTTWRVVGVVEEVGAAGIAYVTDEAFAKMTRTMATTKTTTTGGRVPVRMLRVATTAASPAERIETIRVLESTLAAEKAKVLSVIPLALLRTAMGDHIVVLTRLLFSMAALMMIVGTLGLASTMGTNVLERTREIGIMKTMGGTPRQIARLVVGEALVVSAMSWVASVTLSIPLSLWVGNTVGALSFRLRLPLVLDLGAWAWWLGLAAVVAVMATFLPARRASRLSIREALIQL